MARTRRCSGPPPSPSRKREGSQEAAMTFSLPDFDLDGFVRATLAEDLGKGGDITSQAVIPADARFSGVMDSRDSIVVAGLPIAEAFFRSLDPEIVIERLVDEG